MRYQAGTAMTQGDGPIQNPTPDPNSDSVRPARIRQLTVLGRRVHTAIRPGDGTRTPLLMLNGMGAHLELLAPLGDALDGYEVITFDVPGVGESPTPWHPYTLPMLVTLIEAMLTELGYEQVDVFGLSWGGMLAQQFAFQNPRRCRRLILAATMPGVPMVPPRLSTLLKVATPRRLHDPAYFRRIAGEIYGGAARTHPLPLLDQQGGRGNWLGYLLQQLAVAGWGSHLFLPMLRQPTLIMAGDDDPIVPLVNARLMACLIPRSRLHVLHDGHHFFRFSSRETASAIREFLESPRPA